MTVLEISNFQDWNAFIKSQSDLPFSLFIIDFYATWCGPCIQMKPKFKELSELYPSVAFLAVDIEKVEELVELFDQKFDITISSIPAFIIIQNGVVYKTIVGPDIKAIKSGLENALSGF